MAGWRRWPATVLATTLWLTAAGCAAPATFHLITPVAVASPPIAWTGEITRGGTFALEIAPGLELRLIPDGEDWEIWVGEPAGAANFAAVVTPPMRGVNARHLQGRHFRNLDNSGPNVAGDLNVNAPQATRPFCFALTADAFTQTTDWLSARQAGTPAPDRLPFPTATGVLTITDLTLGNLAAGQQAWIEHMTFAVTLDLSQPCPPF